MATALLKATMAEQDTRRTGNELYSNHMFIPPAPVLPSDRMNVSAIDLDVALAGRLHSSNPIKNVRLYSMESEV